MLWNQPIINRQTRNVCVILHVMSNQRKVLNQSRRSIQQIHVWRGPSPVEQGCLDLSEFPGCVRCHVQNSHQCQQILDFWQSARWRMGPECPSSQLGKCRSRDVQPPAVLYEAVEGARHAFDVGRTRIGIQQKTQSLILWRLTFRCWRAHSTKLSRSSASSAAEPKQRRISIGNLAYSRNASTSVNVNSG